MTLKDVDLIKLSKLTSQQIDQITCLECCKYFIAPETAACGHTLCHSCWSGRRTCPSCSKPIERRNLRHNRPIQNLTEHVHALSDAFEKLFDIRLDDFLLDTGELESEEDPTKNVKDWLASSQNHFSAPGQSSELSSQEIQQPPNPLNVSSNKIQIHINTPKAKSPENIVLAPIPQDDWDKIEPMPDTEDIRKDKENIIGPMDIEPFFIHENEYTVNNPRRSSRKKELKPTETNNKMNEKNSFEKQSSKDSSGEIDKKSNNTKQNWNNVKRMRKEFSKLNKKNRNKLNVSIEMCKKTQNSANNNVSKVVPSQIYEIDENTPNQFNIDNQILKETLKEQNETVDEEICESNINENINEGKYICKQTQILCKVDDKLNNTLTKNNDNQKTNAETIHSPKEKEAITINATENLNKMPFYKRGALHPKSANTKNIETINHNIETDAASLNDDIEITIRVGNTITNIFIKKKNEVQLKVNTDREIQTSLGPLGINKKNNLSPQNTQNIVINLGDNQKVDVDVENQLKRNPRVEELKKNSTSVKTVSGKKNTASADTATAQFEITESVEKELSKIMDQVDEPTKSNSIVEGSTSQSKKSRKPAANPDNHEFNDLDMFDSESVNEADVQLLKNTNYAPSEILRCTFKTKNKTQKQSEKRDRDPNDEDPFPMSKKAKLHNNNSLVENISIEPNKSKQNQNESESTNYDTVMGQVFANIDADVEEIHQSHDINKNTQTLNDNNKKIEHGTAAQAYIKNKKRAQEEINEFTSSVQLVNEFCNQKDSENIFSVCAEKEGDMAPSKEKVPTNLPPQNIDEFLTPVTSRNLECTGDAVVADNDVDDSDRSVVEETPQKTTSFLKLKQKSNGGSNDFIQIQNVELKQRNLHTKKNSSESANITSVVNLTDPESQMKSGNNVAAIEAVDKKLETPLTIKKFFGQIQHNSTPNARKSLNFDKHNVDDLDPEQTLCPTNEPIVKTTQEREFMIKAFEKTPTTPSANFGIKNLGLKNKKYRIAGSCLTVAENNKLKALCARHKWIFTVKYSKDLTHLVVGVDDENKAQRSVKYMCALASSIWIVSFLWVEKCLESNVIVDEDYYEALDSTGEPGPMRSRIATRKLFQGITFFCMEPFSVLDVNTLKGMLEAAGGKVVNESKEVKVTDKTGAPAMLLAEPENTQEDRFIFLAMELCIVPVNYEWALNCLGSYSLCSIQELLLCPASLLPKATEKWPPELLAPEED